MEAICNQTASDPNSTLFRYMQSDDKDEVVAQKKISFEQREHVQQQQEEGWYKLLLKICYFGMQILKKCIFI